MSVSKLEKGKNGNFICPVCGKDLEHLPGGQVRLVNGKADYDNVKPKQVCRSCGKFYRELLNTGYYDVFPLTEDVLAALDGKDKPQEDFAAARPKSNNNPVVSLTIGDEGKYVCPRCNQPLLFCEGGAVRIVDGKVDYENVKPRYVCKLCGVFYRELLKSGLYEVFDLDEKKEPLKPVPPKKKRKVKATGDLQPMRLKRDAKGTCPCPRCGADMLYLEPEAVKIVNGKADMRDTVARFRCDECDSLYREIAGTGYFQWSEK